MSEVKGTGLESQAAMVQDLPRGATPRPRPGMMAERSYTATKVRGNRREEPPRV